MTTTTRPRPRGAACLPPRAGRALLALLTLLLGGVLPAAEDRVVSVGNLIYAGDKTSVCFSDRFLTTVATETGVHAERRMRAVRLGDAAELQSTPFVVMNGNEEFTLPEHERTLLKQYLTHGGFLLASAGCSSEAWNASFVAAMHQTFGPDCLTPIGLDHPLFHTLFPVTQAPLHHGGNATFAGIILDGRLACLYSREGLNDTAHTEGCCCCGGNEIVPAERIVADALVYALVQ